VVARDMAPNYHHRKIGIYYRMRSLFAEIGKGELTHAGKANCSTKGELRILPIWTRELKMLKYLILLLILCTVPVHSAGTQYQLEGLLVNVREFGAKGDGITDDTLAIKAAILSLRKTGGTVFFPKGIYIVGIPSPGLGGYLNNYILPLVSNLIVEGVGGASVLKLKDNFLNNVNDAEGNAHIMAGMGLDNVTIRNMTFDGNGRNNLAPAGKIRNAMFIYLDAKNITIENNVLKNCAGYNMITTSGKKALIKNNRLLNGGHYVGSPAENKHNADFSFMYIASSDSIVSGNIIEQEDPDIALRGYTGGIELHGSNTTSVHNTVKGCNPAIYIVNDTNSSNIDVSQNVFEKCIRGVVFWNTDYSMRDVSITSNTISLYKPTFRSADVAYGIGQEGGSVNIFSGATANGGYVENLIIRNNTITSASSPQSPAIQGIRLHSINRCFIENNIIDGLSDIGIVLSGSPWGIDELTIRFNKITNCGSAQQILAAKAALYIQTHGFANKPARVYFMKNVLIEKNEFGNTHKETLDSKGNIVGNECKGYMLTGIVLAGYDAKSKVENFLIRENNYTNLIWKTYGTADALGPERTNPGLRSAPDVIVSKVKPLTNRQMFGNEIVHYPDGSKFRCTQQGYFSNKTGTMNGKEGMNTAECDNSNGLRVGMYIVITGAGKGGANLYTFIKSIDNNRLALTDMIGKPGGVNAARYSIIQPVLAAF
jgi:parallel beta-helix repeat protein